MDVLDDRGLSFLFPLLRIQADLWKQVQKIVCIFGAASLISLPSFFSPPLNVKLLFISGAS